VTDPFVIDRFTGIPDAVAGANETASPSKWSTCTTEALPIVTAEASVTMYAVFSPGNDPPKKPTPTITTRIITRMTMKITLMTSDTP
jgi:hypothetical protein